MNRDFLPQKGHYENLYVYKLAGCIYAITYYFANKYFSRGDRTIDQMVQAARSGKQNIAEGSVAGATSSETEIKLTNVAKASMHELRIDYEDYLLTHGLEQWDVNSDKVKATRAYCKNHCDAREYIDAAKLRSDEAVANIAITMLHQFDVMITNLIETQKRRFLANGGIKEEMYRARTKYRGGQD